MRTLNLSHSAQKSHSVFGFFETPVCCIRLTNLKGSPLQTKKFWEKRRTFPEKNDLGILQTRPVSQMHENVSGCSKYSIQVHRSSSLGAGWRVLLSCRIGNLDGSLYPCLQLGSSFYRLNRPWVSIVDLMKASHNLDKI